ncbi:MAG: DUF1257 domain-containing protein [bacterium]
MSLTCIIVPIVVGGWPLLSTLAAAAAAGLGYKLMNRREVAVKESSINEIEITDEKSRLIEDSLKPEEELIFTKEGITITFKKDVREKFIICVQGENKSNEVLNRVGRQFLNRIKQQYAYQKVKEEMNKKGFNVVEETKIGNRIRIVLRRF